MDSRTDVDLITLASDGDEQAYGQIVEKYQNLICSMAYSGCGDFAQSEDLAQETFVTAWKQLANLHDPSRLRGWLCGIARNLIASHRRSGRKKGVGTTVSLEEATEPIATASSPGEAMISREEESLVWQSLESIPENYRAPLVLFYREDQSVEEVAMALELSPEATRQRLSRGRSMLREKVEGLVERTLSQSRPGRSFTMGTLAALPALGAQAKAAGVVATTATGATATKAGAAATWTLWSALLGPLAGLAGGYLGSKASVDSARSPRERVFLLRVSWFTFGATLFFTAGLLLLIFFGDRLRARSITLHTSLLVAWILIYSLGLGAMILWGNRRLRRLFEEEQARGTLYPSVAAQMAQSSHREYRTRATLFGLPLVHITFGGMQNGKFQGGQARGWIAIGNVSYGVLLSIGGVAFGGIAIGGVACGIVSLAGLAVGAIAMGGGAIGWMAAGGAAIAWHAAFGGLAIAVDYALGGLAVANQANTDAAKELLSNQPLLAGAKVMMEHSRWAMLLVLLPLITVWRRRKPSRQERG